MAEGKSSLVSDFSFELVILERENDTFFQLSKR